MGARSAPIKMFKGNRRTGVIWGGHIFARDLIPFVHCSGCKNVSSAKSYTVTTKYPQWEMNLVIFDQIWFNLDKLIKYLN